MDLLNNGYYNSQAVQVLNAVEYDEFDNPIGLYESPSDPSSCNFTVTDNSRCKFVDSNCFQQQVSTCYMTVTGLLATDTVTVFGSSAVPTLAAGRMDFVVSSKYYGVSIFRSGVLWAYYPMCESIINPSGHVYHDVSGNGNHATLINGSVGNEGKQNEFHYLQKGFNKDYKKALGDSNLLSIVTTDSNYSSSIRSGSLFTFTKTNAGNSNGNGISFVGVRNLFIGDIWRCKFKVRYSTNIAGLTFVFRSGGTAGYAVGSPVTVTTYLPLTAPNTWIETEVIAVMKSQEAPNSLMIQFSLNTLSNNTVLDVDLESIELVNPNFLPKHLTNDTDYLGNPLEFQQDGKSFLPSGCFLHQYQQPSLIQADKTSGVWFDPNGEPYDVAYETLTLQDPINEQIFIGNSDKTKKLGPISSHKAGALTEVQKRTERIVRNVVDDPLIEDPAFSHDVTVTAGDLTYSLYNTNGYTMNGIIDWGDGTTQSVNTTATTSFVKTYSAAGTYNVKFTGTLHYFYPQTHSISYANKITKITNWGNVQIRLLRLQGTKITSIPNSPITGFNASPISISNLFSGCTFLTGSIPHDLLKYASGYLAVDGLFLNCTSLTGQIPENLFRYCPNLTSVASAFSGCTGLTGQIPEELLKYNTKLTTVASLFAGCTGLSGSIPENLLKYNVLLADVSSLFYNCSNLSGTIPANLFRYNTEITTFLYSLRNCPKLTGEIPVDLFRYNTKATTFYGALQFNSGLTGSIPEDLLRYNTLVVNVQELFYGCSNLTGIIPQNLFRYNPAITNMYGLFYGCTKLTGISSDLFRYNTALLRADAIFYDCTGITSIPTGVFDYNTNVTTFAGTFRGTRITTIPSNLFVNNTKVTSFSYTFAANPSLSGIPSNLFDTNTLVTTFDNVFNGCTGITSIPTDLFRFNVNVINMSNVFYNTRITAIPIDIFRYNTLVTSFAYTFAQLGTTNTLSIPIDLFRYNTEVTSFAGTFSSTRISDLTNNLFQYNTKVTSFAATFSQSLYGATQIPSGLFANCPLVTTFDSCFRYTGSTTSIPVDLFRHNTLVTSFAYCFDNATIMTGGIPIDLFRYNTEVTDFLGVFQSCGVLINAILPEDLFYYNSKVTRYTGALNGSRNAVLPTRLFNTANLGKVTTWQNFLNVTSTTYSPTGTIQKIWSTTEGGDVAYTVQPTKTDAFNNCTTLSNYAEIPVAWT